MKLALCPHCRKQYPVTATVCPNCWRRIQSTSLVGSSRRIPLYVYALALLTGLAGFIGVLILSYLLRQVFFFFPVPLLTLCSFILTYGVLGFWFGSKRSNITWKWGILLATPPSFLVVLFTFWFGAPEGTPLGIIPVLIVLIVFAACMGMSAGTKHKRKQGS